MKLITNRYKQSELGIIPKEWEKKSLDGLGDCIIGLTYDPSEIHSSGTLVLRASNIQHNTLEFNDNVFVNKNIPKRLMIREGDILICVRNGSRSLIGKSVLIENNTKEMSFGAFMSVFRSKHGKFLIHVFQSNLIKKQIQKNLGATINQITNKTLNSLNIPFPNDKKERDEISDALNNIQIFLNNLNKLIKKKRDLKLSIMQKIITGNNRINGFSGEWLKLPLGEIVNIHKGQIITEKNITPGNIPVIAGGKKHSYFHSVANRYGKTITISASGASAGYLAFHKFPIFASDCSTISESNEYDISFIFYALLLNQNKIYKSQTGGAQPHIHPKDLVPLLINFPKDVKEQIAIASIITDLDSEIVALEKKFKKVKKLENAMLYELITGKTRLI